MELTAEDFGGVFASATQRSRGISRSGHRVTGEHASFYREKNQVFRNGVWKFRIYWSLAGPFSSFMRQAILKKMKTETELKAKV